MHRLPARLALTALTLIAAREAHAQQRGDLALDRFDPAPSGDDFFQVQSPLAGSGEIDFSMMALGEYARRPLTVYELTDGAPDRRAAGVVSDQLFLHIGASLGFYERLQLSIDFPLAVLNRGDSATVDGTTIEAPSGAAVGDLRGGMRLRLFGDRTSPFAAALAGYVFIPTGDDTQYAGTGSARGNPSLVLGGRAGALLWGANGGVMIQEAATFGRAQRGTDLTFGAGAALVLAEEMVQIGPEVYGATLLDKNADAGSLPAFDTKDTTVEAILGMKARTGPIVMGGGIGPGFTKGPGTARLRAVLSIAYAPIAAEPVRAVPPPEPVVVDRDGDGILDDVDACPDVKGVADPDPKKNGCPIADRDSDGVLDPVDACPDVPGVADADPAKNGCPRDRDGDLVYDKDDACPDVKGVPSSDPTKNGCPADTDGDGVLDDADACRTVPGKPNADPKKNGCPMAFVSGGQIVITEQVQFRTDSDFILPASDELLTTVKRVLDQNAEITKVRIEGHTDSRGGKLYNQHLSNRRAASVRKWLVQHGVDDKRLESRGFGLDVPIGDNATEEGRQMNRRVEFKILEGAKLPDVAVHTTGTVPPKAPPAPEKK